MPKYICKYCKKETRKESRAKFIYYHGLLCCDYCHYNFRRRPIRPLRVLPNGFAKKNRGLITYKTIKLLKSKGLNKSFSNSLKKDMNTDDKGQGLGCRCRVQNNTIYPISLNQKIKGGCLDGKEI